MLTRILFLISGLIVSLDAIPGENKVLKSKEVVKTVKCGNKSHEIMNFIYENEVDTIRNEVNGIYRNTWLLYTEYLYMGEMQVNIMLNMKTCDTFVVDGPNLEFFNNSLFLTWAMDFEAGYGPNQISIYSISNGKIKKESEYEPSNGGPEKAKWIDKNTITFNHVTFNEASTGEDDVFLYKTRQLVRKDGDWVLDAN